MTLRTAWTGALVALAVFLASAGLLSPLCLALAPVAIFLLVLYSYGKRFTDFPQILLGIAQLVAPVGAWIAVTNRIEWPAIALGVAVGTWIGGFDLIYSCQDADVDRQIGSRSFPARFGIPAALWASTLTHVATFASFVWFGAAAGLGWLWWMGVALTAVVLTYEHAIVHAEDLPRVNRAFFTANGVIGIGLFVFALADLVAQGPAYDAHALGGWRIGCLGHAICAGRPGRAFRRGRAGGPGRFARGAADDPGRDGGVVPRQPLAGRPHEMARPGTR